jgi:hypothetical protein
LARDDYEEYNCLLELYSQIDRDITLKLARRAIAHDDPAIREYAAD